MTKIVFIEGVSGVGKTTTTTLLYEKLREMGYKADCYLEGANDNPLDPFNGMYPPPMPITGFYEAYLLCWQNFLENQLEKDFMLLDGTLLHHQINDLIREYGASDEVIENHLSNLLHVIQPLKPIVFYLSSEDVGKHLTEARKSRKELAPTEERITFWENRKRIDLYVLNRLSINSQILNINNGWNSILEEITVRIL